MATLVSHGVAAVGIGAWFLWPKTPKRVWIAGVACSVVPDLDVVGFRFGIRYGDLVGHRGLSHSLFFAALLASVVLFLGFRSGLPKVSAFRLWTFLFLATASHGLLDAMTDGGLGVAFFSPLDTQRYFFPWTPIHVSPIGVGWFFTRRSVAVLESELTCIWLPSGILALVAWIVRRPDGQERHTAS